MRKETHVAREEKEIRNKEEVVEKKVYVVVENSRPQLATGSGPSVMVSQDLLSGQLGGLSI